MSIRKLDDVGDLTMKKAKRATENEDGIPKQHVGHSASAHTVGNGPIGGGGGGSTFRRLRR